MKTKTLLIRRALFLCAFLFGIVGVSWGQATFSWRNDAATSGGWNSSSHWWNGAPNLPGGAEILFIDGAAYPTMTNNLPSTNRHKITFGATNAAARTIGGSSTNTFYEFSSTWPRIQNDATDITHTINFPMAASTNSGFNLELVANAGSLVFGGTLNTNGRTIQIYGNNSAIDATNRFVRLGGVVSGTGVLNVSQFGVVKLNASNTYTGETQIDQGELWIESSGTISTSSAIYVGNGGQTTNVTKLWLSNSSGGTTFVNNININNGNATTRVVGGLNTSGTHTFSGIITNNSGGAGSAPTGRFWYMGVPLNSLTRGAAFGSAGTDNRLWSWSELNQQWSLQITDDNEVLSPTTGYVFRTSAPSTTLNFSGTSLYSSNVSLTGLSNSGGTFAGCHLISNPYTAYLDWEQIVDVANSGTSNISTTYCVRSYNNSSNLMVYDYYNATGNASTIGSGLATTQFIAPLQSFWIKVNPTSTGSINFTKSMISHQSSGIGLKDITSFPAFARLNLVSGNFYDQVVIYTDVDASSDLEDFDSRKFFIPNLPQVYCPVGNDKLVINGLKQGKAQTSAPLTVELPSTQIYKFEMTESFVENGLVILEDKQEGILQDMGVNPIYEFYGNSGVIADRFVLHFQLPNGTNNEGQAGVEDLTSGQIAVIANHDGAVTVALSTDLTTSGDIQIFDGAGRLVAQKAITSAQTSLQLNNGMGVYFVRVQTPMKTEMKKVMVY